MTCLEAVIIKPLITEKATKISDKTNRFGFKVQLRASKHQIRAAVEKLYDVEVVDVKTAVIAGKVKRAGKATKKTSSWKKAFVRLAVGQKIEFFKGV